MITSLLPLWFQRWYLSRSLTRISVQLAAARENREELDEAYWSYIDSREVPPDGLADERKEHGDLISDLEEERDYVRGKLDEISAV